MRSLAPFFALIFTANVCAAADPANEIVVITHAENPVSEMTRSQVIDLFMGKYVAYPDGRKAIPLDIEGNSQLKEAFYNKLVKLSVARVNAYWSRIRFTGRASPPMAQKSIDSAISYIQQNENAISYIPLSELNEQLKVVHELDE